MSIPSWTVIVISLSCFTGLFMLVSCFTLARAWIRHRTGSSSPFKLTYSARKSIRGDEHFPASLWSRASSLTSINAYHTDLAVEAERDARRIIEKSSEFEYWWDENEETSQSGSNEKNKNVKTKKDTGRFFTHPQYQSSAKSVRSNCLEKDRSMHGRMTHSSENICYVDKKPDTPRAKQVYLYKGFKGDVKV